jgi:hypothetical protein
MKALSLIFLLSLGITAQQQPQSPDKSLIEIEASISAIQDLINHLTLKKAELERNRIALLQKSGTEAAQGSIVVRVSGERSVVLLTNGRQQEVYLSGVMIKLGRHDEAITFLSRALSNGVAFPRCDDPECFTVEIFADRNQTSSVNCQLVGSGIATLTQPNLCLGNAVIANTPDKPLIKTDSVDGSAPAHAPGTDVKVRGYYRKDGTYVRPHTRSAPGRRKN